MGVGGITKKKLGHLRTNWLDHRSGPSKRWTTGIAEEGKEKATQKQMHPNRRSVYFFRGTRGSSSAVTAFLRGKGANLDWKKSEEQRKNGKGNSREKKGSILGFIRSLIGKKEEETYLERRILYRKLKRRRAIGQGQN